VDWAGAIERETASLRAAATDLDARVPGCPDWDVAHLVRHVGTAHHNAAMIVGQRLEHHPTQDQLQPPDGTEPFGWLSAGTAALLEVARTTDPTTPVWTFGPDHTAEFWFRRMAQETLVHRVDAEQAAGGPSDLDAELAADGVAESVEVFLPLLARADTGPGGAELLLHALDVESSWLLTFGTGSVAVEVEHRRGDACVQGPAADLLLWLWGRVPTDRLSLYGDPALPERLRRICRV
jgi:uncharacterized protein (TIGR03083 family)